jgi:hypothetical protein
LKTLGIEYIEEYGEEMEKRYNTMNEVLDWAKETIQKLVDKGSIAGDGEELNLSEDMLRIMVYHDRLGLYI